MSKQAKRKTMTGVVISNKMDKTIVVRVERKFPHPIFKKVVKTTKKYKVHDEKNECLEGDFVCMQETRPLSKQKRWRLIDVITRKDSLESERTTRS